MAARFRHRRVDECAVNSIGRRSLRSENDPRRRAWVCGIAVGEYQGASLETAPIPR
jgi:hypothetical protein